MRTIFILVDALKSNYLTPENMPFLYQLSQENRYVRQIIPSPGFCERSEIFSGLDGFDTGNFSAIGYIPEESPYQNDGLILKTFTLLEKFSYKYARYAFHKLRHKKHRTLNPYRIPFVSLKQFALTEDGIDKLVPHREIFDVLNEANLSYTLDAFTSLSDFEARYTGTAVEFIKKSVKDTTYFIPYYIGDIDGVGHRFGGDIDNIKPYLRKVDNELREMYKIANENAYAFCVLGDHGMVNVIKKVDIMKAILKLNLKYGIDYEAFYDSTSARFWFYNENAEIEITNKIKGFEADGELINHQNYEEYRIPFDLKTKKGKSIYGDLIWCANPGILISPDYFHSSVADEKGMHGYIKVIEGESTGLLISCSPNAVKETIDKAHSSSVCAELCNLLNINLPNDSSWKRII